MSTKYVCYPWCYGHFSPAETGRKSPGLGVFLLRSVPDPEACLRQSFGPLKQRVVSEHLAALVTTKLYAIVPREELREYRAMGQASSTFSATGAAESYEQMAGRWSRRLVVPFLDFAGLTDDGKILDAGCGTGALTAELLQRTTAAEVTGVDISEGYVAYAREAVKSPRAHFEVGDLTALNYPDGVFDQVFSQLVLLFVPDFEQALRELKRVTKPGGRIAATSWDLIGGLVFNRIFWDVAAMLDSEAEQLRQRAFSRPLTRPNELAQAWTNAGLEEVRSGEITIRTEFISFDDYWKPFAEGDGPIPAYVQRTDNALRRKIEEALRRAYLGGDKDGPRSYTATAWVVSGLKPVEA